MCDGCAPPSGVRASGVTRRQVLGAGLVAGVALALPVRAAGAQGVEVLPRAAWAGDLGAGPITPEPDVRTLVVHHTVDANGYRPDDVVTLLRRIHAFHTGPEKRWPDVAYNFFVDRFGRVWEGRAGSLAAPVAGDATGGSQGFDQKCAFVGDHRSEPPTPEAADAMASLLAMLADRHGIDTAPGASTTFSSRGSNLHPAGSTVTVGTIAGHRSVSRTACPGDAGMALVADVLPASVTARRSGAAATSTSTNTTSPASTTTTPPATTSPTTGAPESAVSTTSPASRPEQATGVTPTSAADGGGTAGDAVALPAGLAAAAALAALAAGLVALRARRDGG